MHDRVSLSKPLWNILKSIGTRAAVPSFRTTTSQRPHFFSSHPRCPLQQIALENAQPSQADDQIPGTAPDTVAVDAEKLPGARRRWNQSADSVKQVPLSAKAGSLTSSSSQSPDSRPSRSSTRAIRRATLQRDHSRAIRRVRQEQRHPQSEVSLQAILRLLDAKCPQGAFFYEKKSRVVRLAAGYTAYFKDNPHESILIISLRTTCHIQSAITHVQDSGLTALHLRGTEQQINDALRILPEYMYVIKDKAPHERLDFQARLSDIDSPRDRNGSGMWTTKIRPAWWTSDSPLPLKAVLSSRPSAWTTISFANYVSDLTARRPRADLRQSAANVGAATKTIAYELYKLLIAAAKQGSYLSADAVDRAFTWFVRHNSYLPLLRRVMILLENSPIYRMTASNYEVLLEAAANADDLHNFYVVLKSMTDKGVQPTWRTQVCAFHVACVRDPTTAIELLKEITQKGVFANIQAVRAISANTIRLLSQDIRVKSLDEILRQLDTLFDPQRFGQTSGQAAPRDWLSPAAANQLADILLLQGRMNDAIRVIKILCQSRAGQKPDRTTLNIFLRSAYEMKDASRVVAILSLLEVGSPEALAKLDDKCWDLLWRVAWRMRMYNMLRVIWRHACMNGQATFELEHRMSKSLTKYIPSNSLTMTIQGRSGGRLLKDDEPLFLAKDLWSPWAGKFVVGVAAGLNRRKRRKAETFTPFEEQMLGLGSTPPDRSSDAHIQRYHRCMAVHRADQAEAGSLVPRTPLHKKLHEAYEKDMMWRRSQPEPLRSLLELTWSDVKDLDPVERELKVAYHLQQAFRALLQDAVPVKVLAGDAMDPRWRHNS